MKKPEIHPRTKELRELMAARHWEPRDVARLVGRTPQTVRVWRVEHTERVIPEHTLKLLHTLS